MDEETQNECTRLAFNLISNDPYAAMDLLECNEEYLTDLFVELNQELNNGYSDEYEIKW